LLEAGCAPLRRRPAGTRCVPSSTAAQLEALGARAPKPCSDPARPVPHYYGVLHGGGCWPWPRRVVRSGGRDFFQLGGNTAGLAAGVGLAWPCTRQAKHRPAGCSPRRHASPVAGRRNAERALRRDGGFPQERPHRVFRMRFQRVDQYSRIRSIV